ncbi:MAG: alkaline phosphatase [Bacteroidales bacterium]|nr:alkaline phosphatase [Bacteroidales bacterium]
MIKFLHFGVIIIIITIFLGACSSNNKITENKTKPKYIFYFIGDGMGMAQAQIANEYVKNTLNDSLAFMYLPNQGNITTHYNGGLITCSAASGTALASGEKTSFNTIGMNTNHTDSLTSLAEAFFQEKMKIGIVASVTIDHATPAVFYANQKKRSQYYRIGKQLSLSGFHYFAGAGYENPNPVSPEDSAATVGNLYEWDKKSGYTILRTKTELESLKDTALKVHMADSLMLKYCIDKPTDALTLADFVKKGIEHLDNPHGFFMMVEGSKIDHACHEHDAKTAINEVIEFNTAFKVALDFYNQHPEETLIIVLADHETGGMSLGFDKLGYNTNLSALKHQSISRELLEEKINNWIKNNSSENSILDSVQYFAGLNSDSTLIIDNTDKKRLHEAYIASVAQKKGNGSTEAVNYGNYEPLSLTAITILCEKAGIGWTTFHHTGVAVPIRTIGVGSELVASATDNAEVARKLFTLMGIKNPNR